MQHLRAITLLCLAIPAAALHGAEATGFQLSPEKPRISTAGIKEASGLASSRRDPKLLWLVNDSGAAPQLHLITTSGLDRGKITLKRAANIDWEDLASFTLGGRPYLIVADTGDNQARRKTSTLYILREPAPPEPGKPIAGIASIAWQIRFRYQGGPRDCEAIGVDARAGKILLVTKRDSPPEIHELPLRPPRSTAVLTTRRIGTLAIPTAAGERIPFGRQPTGFDIAADASSAAVITYQGVFVFPRSPGETWGVTLARSPVVLPPHRLKQAEAIAFSADSRSLFATSEGKGQPIIRYQR